jgi:hypothetical protein
MPVGLIAIAVLLVTGLYFLKLYSQNRHDLLTIFGLYLSYGGAAFFSVGELYTLIR